ncbi:MAG TPA: heavy-metal-associated domain-containing protein [Propionicimonas sp.]|jgi:copper ion binding protein
MSSTTYTVDGMTCSHCAHAVTTEVSKIPGVQAVRVDLAANTVSVDWSQPLSESDVRVAIEEAGYSLR